MKSRKNLSYVLLLSCLLSSPYISQVSGTEAKKNDFSVCKQDNLLFTDGICFETLDDFILSRKSTYENKIGEDYVYGISLSESEFIKIIIDVCKIVKERLDDQKVFDDQKDYCKYVSSQSIRVGADKKKNKYFVKIVKPASSRILPWTDESTPLFWILNMLKHYLGIGEFPRSQKEQANYKRDYPKDVETEGLLSKFNKIASLLLKINCKHNPPIDNKCKPPVWADENGEVVTIPDFIKELEKLL